MLIRSSERWVLTEAGVRCNQTAFSRDMHVHKGGSGLMSAVENDTQLIVLLLGKEKC